MLHDDFVFLLGRDGRELPADAREVEHLGVGAVGGGHGAEVEGLEGGEAGDCDHVGLFCHGGGRGRGRGRRRAGGEARVVVDGVVSQAEGDEAWKDVWEGVDEGPVVDFVVRYVEVSECLAEDQW